MFSYSLLAFLTGLAGALVRRLPELPWYINYSDVWKFFRTAALPGWPYADFSVEYPVLTGLFVKLNGLIGSGSQAIYYYSSVIFLAAAAGATAYFLLRMAGEENKSRVLAYWVFAPSLLVFLSTNWDILAVLPAVAAIWLALRNKPMSASALLAVGASAKFYPVIYLLPLLLLIPKWPMRLRSLGSFALVFAAVNAPFALVNFEGWLNFFSFNSSRLPNFDSVWALLRIFIPELSAGWINAISLLIFCGGIALFWPKIKRASIQQNCLLITLLFLLTNKVFSPQYILWLLPFFILTKPPSKSAFYALEAVNLIGFFFILAWQDSASGGLLQPNILFWTASAAVLARHAILIKLLSNTFRKASVNQLDSKTRAR